MPEYGLKGRVMTPKTWGHVSEKTPSARVMFLKMGGGMFLQNPTLGGGMFLKNHRDLGCACAERMRSTAVKENAR